MTLRWDKLFPKMHPAYLSDKSVLVKQSIRWNGTVHIYTHKTHGYTNKNNVTAQSTEMNDKRGPEEC